MLLDQTRLSSPRTFSAMYPPLPQYRSLPTLRSSGSSPDIFLALASAEASDRRGGWPSISASSSSSKSVRPPASAASLETYWSVSCSRRMAHDLAPESGRIARSSTVPHTIAGIRYRAAKRPAIRPGEDDVGEHDAERGGMEGSGLHTCMHHSGCFHSPIRVKYTQEAVRSENPSCR